MIIDIIIFKIKILNVYINLYLYPEFFEIQGFLLLKVKIRLHIFIIM
jgi:hypothetical protein